MVIPTIPRFAFNLILQAAHAPIIATVSHAAPRNRPRAEREQSRRLFEDCTQFRGRRSERTAVRAGAYLIGAGAFPA